MCGEVEMMTTWRLKACQRCGGDTFVDNDADGWYEQCLMCSHRRELKEIAVGRKKPMPRGPVEKELTAG